jgi:Flp pilus assembly protein TadD
MKKFTDFFTPQSPTKSADDPTKLNSTSKPSVELLVAIGTMDEQGGRFNEAEQKYKEALKLSPKHAGALMAYARFKDRQNQFDEAVRLYQQAIKTQPNEPAVYNDLGLCYARRNRLQDAIANLDRAVQLQPKNALYRNNLATVLVEMGDVDRAYTHLAAVHGEAVAFYNLGYLMYKKGQPQAASVLFAKALEKDPTLSDARIWVERLGSAPAAAMPSPGNVVVRQPSAPYANNRNVVIPSARQSLPVQPTYPTSNVLAQPQITMPPAYPASPAARMQPSTSLQSTPPSRPAMPARSPTMPPSAMPGPSTYRIPSGAPYPTPLPSGNRTEASNTVEDAPLPPAFPFDNGTSPQAATMAPLPGLPTDSIGRASRMPGEVAPPPTVQPLPPVENVIPEP